MSVGVRMNQLEALLLRVQKNAALPRVHGAHGGLPPAGLAPSPSTPESEGNVGTPVAPSVPAPLEAHDPSELGSGPRHTLASAPHGGDLEVDEAEVEMDEDVPESHSGPSQDRMERAFSHAEQAPPLTPPPESGPEPVQMPNLPAHSGPTMEQLGATIALEEGPSRDFDLDEPVAHSGLEASLRGTAMGVAHGAYSDELRAPAEAGGDLARLGTKVVPVAGAAPVAVPQVVVRPASDGLAPVALTAAQRSFQPSSFEALLEASLSL